MTGDKDLTTPGRGQSSPIDPLLDHLLRERWGLGVDDIERLMSADEQRSHDTFPLGILTTDELSSLESIVKYCREALHLDYRAIGQLLSRKAGPLATTYSAARKKHPSLFVEELHSAERIPFSIFVPGLSVLEAICTHLQGKGMRYSDIARALKLDARTVWTVCKRAQAKKTAASGPNSETAGGAP